MHISTWRTSCRITQNPFLISSFCTIWKIVLKSDILESLKLKKKKLELKKINTIFIMLSTKVVKYVHERISSAWFYIFFENYRSVICLVDLISRVDVNDYVLIRLDWCRFFHFSQGWLLLCRGLSLLNLSGILVVLFRIRCLKDCLLVR